MPKKIFSLLTKKNLHIEFDLTRNKIPSLPIIIEIREEPVPSLIGYGFASTNY